MDIIRFEVQCKPRKIIDLNRHIKDNNYLRINKYDDFLSPAMCEKIIKYYFTRTIGLGDWYSLSYARQMIQLNHFNQNKEYRLIDALDAVNQCRGVSKAKKAIEQSPTASKDIRKFNDSLRELNKLGINPVTIPVSWGINHLPNLLESFDNKRSSESVNVIDMEKGLAEFGTSIIPF